MYGGYNNMTDTAIYNDIARRTGGDVYIGVVGPVRSGKSTLIKRFAQKMLLPVMQGEFARERARDEMPQSASGRTVMTTEPKFVPENAVELTLGENAKVRVKLIDCVGYVVPGASGLTEDDKPRMVMTPWSDEPMPFEAAAEIGTRKVIADHASVGVVVTTDGSITDIPRDSYIDAEKRVADELHRLGKPFVIVLNSAHPNSAETIKLAEELHKKYEVSVLPLSCTDIDETGLMSILSSLLYEFPIREIRVGIPDWLDTLGDDNELNAAIASEITDSVMSVKRMGDIEGVFGNFKADGNASASICRLDLGSGSADIRVNIPQKVFYDILSKQSGFDIKNDKALMQTMSELAEVKKEYDRVSAAIKEVYETGYGIVVPDASELTLEEPEIVKQPGGYGVRLKASAPSIHMIRANIETEVSPIVGTERQSETMIQFLLKEFEEDPKKIWESDMFGKSLHDLVTEGLSNKLDNMPTEARQKMSETLQRIINEGSGGLICILL